MNVELKIAIIRACNTQIRAAILTGIPQSSLSHLMRGYRGPTAEEREKLKKFFGRDYFVSDGEEAQAS